MPSYLFLFIMTSASSILQPIRKESLLQVLFVIFIVTFIIPAISIGTLRLSNFITDLHLSDRRQRITPFIFITCFYGVTAYMFYTKLNISNIIFVIFATATLLLLILTIVTYFWKISVHGAGIGGNLGFILALSLFFPIPHFAITLALATIIVGLIAYARISLNAHTPLQVYAGITLGIVLCWGMMYMLL
jgi:hypothetical protein